MSLRSELADHLLKSFGEALARHKPDVDAVWGFMADECIRQMEWARRLSNCDQVERYEIGVRDLEPPLSLAPESWKP